MEIISILIMCIVILLIMSILLKDYIRNIKVIKEIGEDKDLNEITNVLPENEEICKEMLCMLKNENVKVKNGNENSQASLYIVASNSILIANVKNTFTRVQTIAHECLHSVQNTKLLWFNFLFSNVYMLYFLVISILCLFNKLPNNTIFAIGLIMMSLLLFFVRSFLETDAMTKAKFLAKEYMKSKKDVIDDEQIDVVVENFDKINDIGIVVTNFSLFVGHLVKVMIFCVLAII